MKGSVIIDGIDIDDLGMFILRGGDYDFLSFPERKEPEQNHWHEIDGIDPDLSEVYFNEKKVTVRFYIKAESGDEFLYRLNRFYRLISAPGYRQLYSREFGKTFWLRYVDCPELEHRGGLYKKGTKRAELSVEFSMDDPLQIFAGDGNLTPRLFGCYLGAENGSAVISEDSFFIELEEAAIRNSSRVAINGNDLSDFGIIVNQCYNSLLKLPAAKPPLTRRFDRSTGLIAYAPAKQTFAKKQVTIECTMIAGSRAEFYYNYIALFNHMAAAGTIALSTYWAKDAACYYSAMRNFRKPRPFASRVLVSFALALVQISPGLIDYVLGTEDVFAVVTEDGDYFIEV